MAPGAAGASAGLSVRMEDLVGEQLAVADMKAFDGDELTRGLRMYVEGQADGIKDAIEGQLHELIAGLRESGLPRLRASSGAVSVALS